MKRRFPLVTALLLAGGLATTAGPPRAVADTEVLDQHSDSHSLAWLVKGDYAQTFVVGRTGTLDGVALWIFTEPGGNATVDVQINPVSLAGFPTGTSLSSGGGVVYYADYFHTFRLAPFHVTAGQRLSLVFHVLSNCNVRGDAANPYRWGMAEEYANGKWQGFKSVNTIDFAFEEWVVVASATPTPPSTAPPPTPNATATAPHATALDTPSPAGTAATSAAASEIAAASPAQDSGSAGTSAAAASSAGASASAAGAAAVAAASAGAAAASGSDRGGPQGGSGDMTLPAILAAAVAVVGAFLLAFAWRRRRTSG